MEEALQASRPERRNRETDFTEPLGSWLILAGAVVLFASLFLTWSHQFSPLLLGEFGSSEVLNGVPRDPTAWQVYSSADVLLAVLAAALIAASMFGNRAARQCAMVAALIALIFVVHALAVPPTNGVLVFNPANSVPDYVPNTPGAGIGETFAILGLLAAIAGLAIALRADRG
jgi:hypothetical protein